MNEKGNNTNQMVVANQEIGFEKLTKGLDALREYSEIVLKSSIFNKQLESVEDIMNAIMVGQEIGISPRLSIMMGKKLNANAAFSVMKGRGMGLDPITAIENIHIISTKNGDVSVTGVHIISSQLSKAGVKVEILKDYAPLYKYIDGKGRKYDISYVQDNPILFHISGTSGDTAGKIKVAIANNPDTYHTLIQFTRTLVSGFINKITISYSLQEATEAKLYKGVKSDGTIINGKGNWNENPATMLRNRCISIGGRIIASDYLQGVYEYSEIIDSGNNDGYSVVAEEGKTILVNKEGKVINGEEGINTQVK